MTATIASRSDGRLSVGVVTATGAVKVFRQLAPEVWPSGGWVTIPGASATDVELVYMTNGLLAAAWKSPTGTPNFAAETAVGVWSASTDLSGVVSRITLAAYPSGTLILAGIGSPNTGMWYRTFTAGTWTDWSQTCIATGALTDMSVTVVGTRAVMYAAMGTNVVNCTQPASGITWTYDVTYTGTAGAITAVGAATTADSGVILLATVSGAQAWTKLAALGSAASTFTSFGATNTDFEVESMLVGRGLSNRLTGATYAMTGTWTSATIDTGTTGSHVFGMLRTSTHTPTGTAVTLQVAGSNSGTPTDFIGPDGTSATSFPAEGGRLPIALDGNRYFRVKATLTGTTTATPTLTAMTVRYNLVRTTRSLGGTYAVGVPADCTAWIVRVSTPLTELSAATLSALSQSTPWASTTKFSAHFASAAPQCCAAAQFTVNGTTTTPATVQTPMIVSGGRVGQSLVLNRTALRSDTGGLVQTARLSPSLVVQMPMTLTLTLTLTDNSALGRTAAQKSNWDSLGLASKAVDGVNNASNVPDGVYANGSESHTN